jgi:hypothetical protein
MKPGTIDDTARRIAHARWLELRCFEVLGGWVLSTPEPDVKLALARQSHHHAWHAELFERVLPVANGLDPERHDEPPAPWRDLLAGLAALEHTADRLVGAYELLIPAKLAEYDAWLESADPIRDAPLRRWLGFVVADERADLSEGRVLLHGLEGVGSAPARPGLEAALLRAGALLG